MRAETDAGAQATPVGSMEDAHMETGRMAQLVRLEDLDDFEVASGDPDPLGWDVKARDGQQVGTVKHLIVDLLTMRVRYLEVELHTQLGAGEKRHVHVPLSSAHLSDDVDEVVVERGAAAIELLETANLDRAAEISDAIDDHRFFGQRRAGRDDVQYLVRRERRY